MVCRNKPTRPIRVLHVFKTYFPDTYGGIEQVVRTLAENSVKQGVECRVLVLTPGPSSDVCEPKGYRLIRCHQNFNLASTGFSWQFFQSFRTHADWADIVHVHYPWPFVDLVCLLTRARTPMVMTYHSDIVNQPRLEYAYAPLRNWFLRRQARIVATSPNYVHSSPILPKYSEKVSVIPIGIGRADPPPQALEIEKWQEKLGKAFFVFIGVPRYYKGLSFLLEALRGRNYPLAVIGDGGDRAALEKMASTFGLSNTHFLGALSETDKHNVLAGARCLVLPSHRRSEAFGIVLAEASALGVPMITCEIGTGTSYVNLHEVTGLVVPPTDTEALGGALDQVWNDEARVKRWAESARTRYETEFGDGIMAARYTALYQSVMASELS